ncbi:MAG: hypothetical protein KKG47_13805 [Proteobacteria bacterium]|nr:hypothetical protein [Pseudomonadota bacterium]MBU1739084.1 hypothetical protein [Pseudomonadota bacterium]
MSAENKSITPDDMRIAMRMMLNGMLNNALKHFDHVDVRTLRVLQYLDLWRGTAEEPFGDEVDLAVLNDPEHPRRLRLSPGPSLVYTDEGIPPRNIIVDLSILLLSGKSQVRKAAMDNLDRMVLAAGVSVTPKTQMTLAGFRDNVVKDDGLAWREAAVEITDALADDALFALQGVSQSLELPDILQDRLNVFARKVLHPSNSSLIDSVNLEVVNPSLNHPNLTAVIGGIMEHSESLAGACAAYVDRLGFVPLAPPYGLAEVVRRWIEANPETDIWEEIWGWASSTLGPVGRYHACSVFVEFPEYVPPDKHPILWQEVLGVVGKAGDMEADDPDEDQQWALRCALARHYIYHFEAHVPDSEGESITSLAWWFAGKVAQLFPDTPGGSQFYRKNWVSDALELSARKWLHTKSIGKSALRHATLILPSPWAVGLLAMMGRKLDDLKPDEQEEIVRIRFHNALLAQAIHRLPFSVGESDDPTYTFEYPLTDIIAKWSAHQPDEQRKGLDELVAEDQNLSTAKGICDALRTLGDTPLHNQIVVAFALRTMVYLAPEIGNDVWEVIAESDWRHDVLGKTDIKVLELLLSAFAILHAGGDDKWLSMFPRFVAESCEAAEEEELRRLLFYYSIQVCLVTDTISGLQRLLRGAHKRKFIVLTQEFREQVEAYAHQYPAWIRGRLRGVLAVLRVE